MRVQLEGQLGGERAALSGGRRSAWWAGLFALALASGACWAAPTKVYLRTPTGQWVSKPVTVSNRTLHVTISPAEAGGSTMLLLHKPAWMVLPDDTPPQVLRVTLGKTALNAAEGADWGALPENPAKLLITLTDNANPLDPGSIRFTTDGAGLPVTLGTSNLQSNRTSGAVTIGLPKLAAGRYQVRLECTDRSPMANRVVRHWSFAVPGVAISADRQEVRLVSAAGEFTFAARAQATLVCGKGPAAYLTSRVQGQHTYLEHLTEVEVLDDTPARQRVRIIAEPGKTDRGGEGTKLARLEYDLETRAGLPAILVTSRTVNLGEKSSLYCWWGWLPGAHYETSQGTVEWSGQYKDVGKVGWVYLASTADNTPGLGWIAPGVFGESRFNTMLLYTDPRDIETGSGESVTIRFALMAAKSAGAVAAAAEKIKTLGLW